MKDFANALIGCLVLYVGAFCIASGVLVALKVFGVL